MQKIVILVKQGMVQRVYALKKGEYIVLDMDVHDYDPDCLITFTDPETGESSQAMPIQGKTEALLHYVNQVFQNVREREN